MGFSRSRTSSQNPTWLHMRGLPRFAGVVVHSSSTASTEIPVAILAEVMGSERVPEGAEAISGVCQSLCVNSPSFGVLFGVGVGCCCCCWVMGCATLGSGAAGKGLGNNRFHFVGGHTLYKVNVQRGRHVVIRTGENWVVNKVCPWLER